MPEHLTTILMTLFQHWEKIKKHATGAMSGLLLAFGGVATRADLVLDGQPVGQWAVATGAAFGLYALMMFLKRRKDARILAAQLAEQEARRVAEVKRLKAEKAKRTKKARKKAKREAEAAKRALDAARSEQAAQPGPAKAREGSSSSKSAATKGLKP